MSLPSPTAAGPPPPNPSPPAPPATESSPALHMFSENNNLETLASKLLYSNDPVVTLDSWLHESDLFNQSDGQNNDFDFSPNMSQNIDIYEEDDITSREEHYRTSTPLPTPPDTPEAWMYQDTVFEDAYKNQQDFCTTPTRPLDELHPQTTRHETDAPTLYAQTPVQVKSCDFFFNSVGKMIRANTHVMPRKHKYYYFCNYQILGQTQHHLCVI